MGITISGGVKIPQGKFSVYTPPPPPGYALFSWGDNSPNGQLGDGTIVDKSSPVQVGALIDWAGVSAGIRTHALAIKTDGTLWGWGNGALGRLGDRTIISKSSPVQIGSLTTWSSVGAGGSHSLAIKTDGSLWTWGKNTQGQLAQLDIIDISSPIQIGSDTDWASIAIGSYESHAIKTDGTLWGWGHGSNGKVGDGTSLNRSSPVQIGALSNWSSIDSGLNHSFAINTTGELFAWGQATSGKLGTGVTSPNNTSSPTQVGNLTDWAIASSGDDHSLALKTNGELWAWGGPTYGRLGNETTSGNKSSPIQIGSLTDWSSVTAGRYHSHALKTNGTIWAWGDSGFGQQGQGDIIDRSSPVQVGVLTNWVSIDAGLLFTLAIQNT